MSRIEHRAGNYRFTYGLDHVTGPFLQIWLGDETEAPALSVDNLGVHIKKLLRDDLLRLAKDTERDFEAARQSGNQFPNLDAETICKFARRLGLNIDTEVYEALN